MSLWFIGFGAYSQVNDTIPDVEIITPEVSSPPPEYDPLAPARAAFYSAVIPGLGQAHNRKYWKIPLVYGGMATGIAFYNHNNKQYREIRDIYKRRLAGYTDDRFPNVSDETLVRAQQRLQRNKDISLAVTVGIYLLNILDANIDAHLKQYNVSDDLSVRPGIDVDPVNARTSYGLVLGLRF